MKIAIIDADLIGRSKHIFPKYTNGSIYFERIG